jgi:hypothetical protein
MNVRYGFGEISVLRGRTVNQALHERWVAQFTTGRDRIVVGAA